MIFRPSNGSMWDPSVLWHDGKYYAIMMHNPDGPNGLDASCGLIAISDDGVHWHDGWVAATEPDRAVGSKFFKAFIGKVGNRFVMDHGVFRANGRQDILRFYESSDLRQWRYLFSNSPDPKWYEPAGRWDHMYILPKDEGNPSAGYWGYPVATPKPGLARGLGMMDTKDGRDWKILPPPELQWGDVPPKDLEIGGCERIGGKYIIIGGSGDYLSDGYSMYSLVSDEPRGPFGPDTEAYRVCGTSTKAAGWGVSFLAAWCRGKDGEKLISNYVSVPSGTWMLPLRKAIFRDGHLRLGWWPPNRSLKGDSIGLDSPDVALPAAGKNRQVAWIDPVFDLDRGAVIEGTIRAKAMGDPASVGFAFSETAKRTMEIRLGIGSPEDRETHIGRYNGITGFSSEDVTGRGCATARGVGNGREHTFRLLVRHDLFELYVDDLLVQTYVYKPCGGRVGLLASGADVTFKNLAAYPMTL